MWRTSDTELVHIPTTEDNCHRNNRKMDIQLGNCFLFHGLVIEIVIPFLDLCMYTYSLVGWFSLSLFLSLSLSPPPPLSLSPFSSSDGCGYLEDRRPSSNCDPYTVAEAIVRSTITGWMTLMSQD